jgi:hypothetical protein
VPHDNHVEARQSAGLSRPGFQSCFPGGDIITPIAAAAIFFCIRSRAKEPDAPGRAFMEPKGHDLPHFEAIVQTPLSQLHSVVQIGFAFLPSLPGGRWRRSKVSQSSVKMEIRA